MIMIDPCSDSVRTRSGGDTGYHYYSIPTTRTGRWNLEPIVRIPSTNNKYVLLQYFINNKVMI